MEQFRKRHIHGPGDPENRAQCRIYPRCFDPGDLA